MLTNTFLHIPYVKESTEKKIWSNNINCWDDFLTKDSDLKNSELIKKSLMLSVDRYQNKDFEFFSSKLPSKYHWRAYEDFKNSCCFLDIETTGLSKHNDDITTIGIYDGKKSKVFVNGIDMHKFSDEIKKYSMIITFNGATFDIPFIKNKFPKVKFNQFHADLRFILRRLGFTGGLKKIEQDLGISRESDLSHLTGRDAIKLWYKYKYNQDKKALDTLIRYNIEDIENLKTLMDMSYEKLKSINFSS